MAKSYRFDPKRSRSRPGDRVTWTNEDNFTHTVQVDGQEDHKVERGESVSIAFASRHLPLRLHAAQPGHGGDGDRRVNARGATSSSSPARSAPASTAPSLRRTSRRATAAASASSSSTRAARRIAIALTLRRSRRCRCSGSARLRRLLVSYVLATTSGFPSSTRSRAGRRLAPCHQGIEAVGLLTALTSSGAAGGAHPLIKPKGTLT
jgi:hypothetical protein